MAWGHVRQLVAGSGIELDPLDGKGVVQVTNTGGGGGGIPSDTVVPETTAGQLPNAGVATTYSRGDHTHGTPAGGGDGENVVVMLADRPNATTTLADATGLSFIADANSTYIIEAFLVWNSSGTAVGIKVSATASGSPTIMSGHFICDAANGTPDGSSYNANDVVVTTSASPFTTGCMGQLAAVLKTGVSASTWQLRFAAETTGTITLKAGSTIRYRKVA